MPIAIPAFPAARRTKARRREILRGWSRPIWSAPVCFARSTRAASSRIFLGPTRRPRFPDWRQINAQALVTGSVQTQGDGRLRVEFRLWDVFAEQQLAGFAYTTTRQNWRRIAHIIADADLQADHRRGRLFRYPHRLHRRIRPGPETGQASRPDGPGRRQPSVPDRRQGTGADAALLAVGAGDHLPVLRQRRRRASICSTSTPASRS